MIEKIKGLCLIDTEPSKGGRFYISQNIKDHLALDKTGKPYKASELDDITINKLKDIADILGKESLSAVLNYKIVKDGSSYAIVDNYGKYFTNGDVTIKKIKFQFDKSDNSKIIGTTALNKKVMTSSQISTIIKEIKKIYGEERAFPLAGTNIDYDMRFLKIAISIAYALSNEKISKNEYVEYINMLNEMNVIDTRYVFIDTILNTTSASYANDYIKEKYIEYCLSNGFVTRRLNLRTTQEVTHNFSNWIDNESHSFIKQEHTSSEDVEQLSTLISNHISLLAKNNTPFSFDTYNNSKITNKSFQNISLRDNKDMLKKNGYLIYSGNEKEWVNVTEEDIDSITYVPKRAYDDDIEDVKTLIEDEMKIISSNKLNVFKESMKKIIKAKDAKTMSEKYKLGIVSNIKKVTIDELIEKDIYRLNSTLTKNRINRVKYIIYYFFEQNKIITQIYSLNQIHGDRRKLSVPNTCVSYSDFILLLSSNNKAMEIFMNSNKVKNPNANDLLLKYQDSLKKAMDTENMEYLAGTALSKGIIKNGNKTSPRVGGIYYELKRASASDASILGNDSIIWSNGNGLSVYYGFFLNNSFLYVSFKRKGENGYKSYVYNGLDYRYYILILKTIYMSGSIGRTVWKTLRDIKKAIPHRQKVERKVTRRSKYFEDVSGESVKSRDEIDDDIRVSKGFIASDIKEELTEEESKTIGGYMYVKAFFMEASSIRRKQ